VSFIRERVGAVLVVLVATSIVLTLVIVVVVVVAGGRHLHSRSTAVASAATDVSDIGSQHDDIEERLLPSDNLLGRLRHRRKDAFTSAKQAVFSSLFV